MDVTSDQPRTVEQESMMGSTPRSRHGTRLRAAWCRRSRAMNWAHQDEWWYPVTDSTRDCYDPLTGLVTPAYLRTRITELYRTADLCPSPSATHSLTVVALDAGMDPWRRIAAAIVVSHKLACTFDGGETIACLSEQRFGVVAATGVALDRHVDQLRRALFLEHGAEVWNVSLPETLREALDLLHDVGQPAMTE